MYSVKKQDDMGKYKLEEIIEVIATRTDFEVRSLIPIYESYNAVDLSTGCSASKLRDAIRARLTKDELFALVADVALDENESILIGSDSEADVALDENESILIGSDSESSM